jgi:osmotically inducible protein OsmC
MADELLFSLSASWDISASEGRVGTPEGSLSVPHAGSPSLGGKGGHTNPEELLMAAVSTCFVQTWAIFLAKLKLPVERPEVGGTLTVEKDPAGGFRVAGIELRPRVSSELWENRRADVEKSLTLAEKYCIVSKAVRDGKDFRIKPLVV